MLKVTVRVRRPYVPAYCPNNATTYYDYSTVENCRPLAVQTLKNTVDSLIKQGLKVVDTFITTLK